MLNAFPHFNADFACTLNLVFQGHQFFFDKCFNRVSQHPLFAVEFDVHDSPKIQVQSGEKVSPGRIIAVPAKAAALMILPCARYCHIVRLYVLSRLKR